MARLVRKLSIYFTIIINILFFQIINQSHVRDIIESSLYIEALYRYHPFALFFFMQREFFLLIIIRPFLLKLFLCRLYGFVEVVYMFSRDS